MLAAGKLDRRITLERFGTYKDEFNSDVEAWGPLCTVYAAYEPIRDGEKFRAGETAAGLSARFTIRYSSQVADLNPKDRLTFKGVTYDILNLKEVEGRNVGLEITCAARGDGAA